MNKETEANLDDEDEFLTWTFFFVVVFSLPVYFFSKGFKAHLESNRS